MINTKFRRVTVCMEKRKSIRLGHTEDLRGTGISLKLWEGTWHVCFLMKLDKYTYVLF